MSFPQEQQQPLDRAVCDAMVASSPEDWNVIILTLERAVGVTAVGELSHSLDSPDHNGTSMPNDSLYVATYKLDTFFQNSGALFRRAVYRVELLPDSWKYSADFEYDKKSQEAATTKNRKKKP